MIRIYADFNNTDEEGRVRLNTVASLRDIESHRDLMTPGAEVLLYMTSEFEVHGTITWDGGIWRGVPDWSTIRYVE